MARRKAVHPTRTSAVRTAPAVTHTSDTSRHSVRRRSPASLAQPTRRRGRPPKSRTIKVRHTTGLIYSHRFWETLVLRVWNVFPWPSRLQWSQWRSALQTESHQVSHAIPLNRWLHLRRFTRAQAKPVKVKPPRSTRHHRPSKSPASRSSWQWVTRPWIILIKEYPWRTALSLLLSAALLAGAYSSYLFVFKDLPKPQELVERQQPVTTRILDRNGQVLFKIYKDENRTLIPLSQVPSYMVQATIAIEDQHFYQHHGFSLKGITRAFLANSQHESESIQGGSTITQQLVKNRLLSPEKTWRRKVREAILAILVEGTYSKDQILEMYFNEVSYGGSTYGVEEAAHRYFGKSARDLTLGESALLAGLPQAPSIYSPYGSTPELAYVRQEEVLRRMVEDGYITVDQASAARAEQLTFRPDVIDIQAPHFVMYVKKMLAEQYGEALVNEGGLEVRTTLDLNTHLQAQKIVTDELTALARLRINNGAALVTNPQTGEILAMVGSKDYFDFAHDGQVNVTLRPRQPGSSIKPITYATAFERGKNPSSTEEDAPITYFVPGSKPYAPKNYDGRYHGKVTLREALGSSYNIPAVKLLAWLGVNSVIDKAEDMGISTWQDRQRFGLSLTLGGGEVLMTDMAEVYGTFANQGYTVDLNPLLEVKNYKGETLYRNTCALDQQGCPKRKTLDERVAYQITDVLSDNLARTPAFGPQSVLTIPGQQVAVKTGTTNSLRDNWTIGYTSDRVVAVWVGNNDNTPMSYVASGITGASPIWNKIIRTQLSESQPHLFTQPDGLIKVKICVTTGTLSCKACPRVREDWFVPGTQPTQTCDGMSFGSATPRPVPTASPQGQILEGWSTDSQTRRTVGPRPRR